MSRFATHLRDFQSNLRGVSEADWLKFLDGYVPTSPLNFAQQGVIFLRLQMPEGVPSRKVPKLLMQLSLAMHRVMGYERRFDLHIHPIPPFLSWQELKEFVGLVADGLVDETVLPNRFMARFVEQLGVASIVRCVDTNATFVIVSNKVIDMHLGDETMLVVSGVAKRFIVLAHGYNERSSFLRGDEILAQAMETLAVRKFG